MGSAIGDYIHWSLEGYNTYGIYRKGRGRHYNFSKKNISLQNHVKNFDTKALQKKLNDVFSAADKKGSSIDDSNELIYQVLQEKTQEKFGGLSITSTGNVIKTNEIKNDKLQSIPLISTQLGNRSINNIKNKLNKAIINFTILQDLVNSGKLTSAQDYGKHIETIQAWQTQFKELTDDKTLSIYKNRNKVTLGKKGNTSIFDVKEINKLLKLSMASVDLNNEKGEMLERALNAIVLEMDNEAGEVTAEAIKKAVKNTYGGQKHYVSAHKSKFSTGVTNKMIENHEFYSTVFNKNVKNKVDVSYIVNGKKINISAKNINMNNSMNKKANDISLVKGTSLFYMIQDTPANFANHYLNAVTMHGVDRTSRKASVYARSKAAANIEMKYRILLQAFKGGIGDKLKANIFVVNDNSASGIDSIHVYAISELMKKIIDSNTDAAKVLVNGAPIEALSLTQSWVNAKNDDINLAAYQRISNLLTGLRAYKINAMISKEGFKNL